MSAYVLKLLESLGAVIKDSHVVYTSGKHGSAYINKDALYAHASHAFEVCRHIARAFADTPVETVLGPALGGIVLSHDTAIHLSSHNNRTIYSIYAEKDEQDVFVLKRGYGAYVKDKQVLVVEDVLNTGGSAREVVELVKQCGGDVVGLGALCNRGDITAQDLDVPKLHALIDITLDAWEADKCTLCASGIPINTSVGKGAEYLEKQKK